MLLPGRAVRLYLLGIVKEHLDWKFPCRTACHDEMGLNLALPKTVTAELISFQNFCCCCWFETVSCGPSWPSIHYVAKDGLEILVLLSQHPEDW